MPSSSGAEKRVASPRRGANHCGKGYVTEGQGEGDLQVPGHEGGHHRSTGIKIRTKIGQGAMGAIYKALQIPMDRNRRESSAWRQVFQNDMFRERFLREARAVGPPQPPENQYGHRTSSTSNGGPNIRDGVN